MAEYNVKLKIYGKGEHICKKCFHYAVCIYQRNNNPIIECSHFVSQSKEKMHGKWKDVLFGWECSVCHVKQEYSMLFDFCPNCGADMREEESE